MNGPKPQNDLEEELEPAPMFFTPCFLPEKPSFFGGNHAGKGVVYNKWALTSLGELRTLWPILHHPFKTALQQVDNYI